MSAGGGSAIGAFRFWGIAFALAGTISFAFRPILVKLAYGITAAAHPVSATTLLFLRMTLSLPFFLAMAWWMRGGEALARRDWLAIVGLGFLGYYLASLLDFLGLQYVSAGVGRLIMFLYPTLVVILSAVFLKKNPTLRELGALAITYTGIALVLSSQISSAPENRAFVFGALLIFASAMCYAVYLVTGSQLVKRVGSTRFTAYTMIVSSIPAMIQFMVLESPQALQLPAQLWWIAIALATMCTVLPVFLVAEALKRIGANHFALIGALGPVTTVLADFALLEGALTMAQIFGGALVISGVLLVSLKKELIMDLGIRGKTALVCAASKGLGKGCAMALAGEGVDLVITARGKEFLEETADQIRRKYGVKVTAIPGDITAAEGRAAALAACPSPDILVNNAGGPPPGDFRSWSREDWIKALDANMLAPIELIKATVDGMIARKFGRIVNITSGAVKMPIPELGLSNGARTGLTGFVAGIARQTVQHNVTINGLLPGPFDTDRLRGNFIFNAKKLGKTVEELAKARAEANPAKRFGSIEEFGAACAFLCSAHAGFITGQNLLMDGGAFPGTF